MGISIDMNEKYGIRVRDVLLMGRRESGEASSKVKTERQNCRIGDSVR